MHTRIYSNKKLSMQQFIQIRIDFNKKLFIYEFIQIKSYSRKIYSNKNLLKQEICCQPKNLYK